ncbi:hypothetical protein ACWELP_24970 [Rhodococcus aetherivorans]
MRAQRKIRPETNLEADHGISHNALTHRSEVSGQLDRRRAAACRVPALACGCTDPWTCRCDRESTLTEQRVDAHRAAAMHLLDAGLMPLVPVDALRELWRRGGEDRALAVHLGTAVPR